jgi:hypothetical protein
MHLERVDIARVVAVVTIAAVAGIFATVRTSGSLLFGHFFPIKEIVVVPPGGCPRAWVAVVRVVMPPVIFWLG